MQRNDLVVLRKYSDEMSARVAALSLGANGIPAQVSADTAGGALPVLALGFPVRLIVRAADADLARKLLATDARGTPTRHLRRTTCRRPDVPLGSQAATTEGSTEYILNH